jgi:hypothetical protein
MASEKFDSAEFLALLEARRAALDALISSYRAALSIGALGPAGDDMNGSFAMGTTTSGLVDLPHGAFLGKSIPLAIKDYLTAARKKQSVRDIAVALREGGVETTAKNFETTVTGALHRLKDAGEVLRFPDGWALAQFYPEGLRARISKQKSKRGRPRKVKRQAEAEAPRGITLKSLLPPNQAG